MIDVNFNFNHISNHLQPCPCQELRRFLDPREMVASQILPVTPEQSERCGAPMIDFNGIRPAKVAKMAGNSMSGVCVGAMLLIAALALKPNS